MIILSMGCSSHHRLLSCWTRASGSCRCACQAAACGGSLLGQLGSGGRSLVASSAQMDGEPVGVSEQDEGDGAEEDEGEKRALREQGAATDDDESLEIGRLVCSGELDYGLDYLASPWQAHLELVASKRASDTQPPPPSVNNALSGRRIEPAVLNQQLHSSVGAEERYKLTCDPRAAPQKVYSSRAELNRGPLEATWHTTRRRRSRSFLSPAERRQIACGAPLNLFEANKLLHNANGQSSNRSHRRPNSAASWSTNRPRLDWLIILKRRSNLILVALMLLLALLLAITQPFARHQLNSNSRHHLPDHDKMMRRLSLSTAGSEITPIERRRKPRPLSPR